MNTISLENFKKEVEQIREYLRHIEYVDAVASCVVVETDNEQIKTSTNQLKEHLRSFGRDKRIFEYKAAIISLYGLLEKYVELWIKEYLDSLASLVPEYNQIDEKIRDNHFEFSLKLINTIMRRESAKYQHLTKEKILHKLNSCIVGHEKYQINAEAFVLSSGNLKHKKIFDLFKLLNINLNDKLMKNESLKREIGLQNPENKDILYNKINELVERRNEIAHGSETSDIYILSVSELEPYIQFLDVYCQAIFEILSEEFIKQESKYTFQKIETVIEIFYDETLYFEIENYTIKVGDMIIIETTKGIFSKKPILKIELDSVSYPELEISEKTNVAVWVEPKIKENQTFYIARK